MSYISNDSHRRFGRKQFATVLVTAIVIVLIMSLSFSGLFAATPNQSPESTPTSTITPPSPTPTATPIPTQTATPNPTRIPVPIDFTCGGAGNPYAFSVTVGVDLNDGMDKAEAITVATAIFDHELTNAKRELRSAEASGSNVWFVGFNWEYGMIGPNGTAVEPRLGHVFDVSIFVQNRTVTYSRCM